ncbi:MAG: hypothetical protein MUP11_05075 [Anaerolineales bacterium]|nr:hypothetical protein [Anaerolineales bacterium]
MSAVTWSILARSRAGILLQAGKASQADSLANSASLAFPLITCWMISSVAGLMTGICSRWLILIFFR